MLVGCSEPIDFAPAEHRSVAPSDDGIPDPITVEPGFVARSTVGRRVTLPGSVEPQLVVATPRFDGRIGDILTTRELSYELARMLDQTTPLTAPSGHRFVAFTAQAGRPAFPEAGSRTAGVVLHVDGAPQPLRSMFGGMNRDRQYQVQWEFIVACIPDEGKLVLAVTDEGQTVQVDLVTGQPIVDEAWQLCEGFRRRRVVVFSPQQSVFERAFTAQPQGYEPATGLFRMTLAPNNAFLAPWNPVNGWAPMGEMWLTIPMNARVEFEQIGAQIELDVPRSLTLRIDGGATLDVLDPATLATEDVRRQRADLITTHRVPLALTGADLEFNAQGTVSVDFRDMPGVAGAFTGQGKPVLLRVDVGDGPDRFGG